MRWLTVLLLLVARAGAAQVGRPEDILALRQMLLSHEFARLDSALAQRQREAASTPANENRYAYAYDAFEIPGPGLRDHLDAWVAFRPESPRARVARAGYFVDKAAEARGSAWIQDTKQSQLDAMRELLMLAVADAARASELDATDIVPYGFVIHAAQFLGADEIARQALARAVAVNPTTLMRRIDYIGTLRPRWGGEEGDMDRFAQASQEYADRNPRLAILLGYSAFERAEALAGKEQYQAAIVAYTEALSHGDFWRYRLERGETYSRMDEPEKALVDLNRSIAERPGNARALAWRANTYVELADLAEGAARESLLRRGREDVRLASLLNPTESHLAWLRENYPELFGPGSPRTTRDR